MAVEGIDGGTLAMVLTVLSAIGGVIATIVRWAHGQFKGFVLWGKPLVEQTVTAHNSLVDTLKATQLETTEHIGTIKTTLHGVEKTLGDHTQALTLIQESRCQNQTGPAVRPIPSNS